MMQTIQALIWMGAFLFTICMVLSWAERFFKVNENPLVEKVNQLLPQTQCAQCNYPGCKPYAQAIVEKNEAINRCPPGGEETVRALATLLQKDLPDFSFIHEMASVESVVRINETACIGCTLCIQACPVDAILGATKQMHTVLTDLCTGCNLCIEPCPVDCIEIVNKEALHA